MHELDEVNEVDEVDETCPVAHHRPCATVLSTQSRLITLEQHGVRAYAASTGAVWAFESATRTDADGTVHDASAWIVAPETVHGLAAWLGY